MKDLFNMIAGTSTGSIISAALSYPEETNPDLPKFFAKDIIEIYITKGDLIFSKKETSNEWN